MVDNVPGERHGRRGSQRASSSLTSAAGQESRAWRKSIVAGGGGAGPIRSGVRYRCLRRERVAFSSRLRSDVAEWTSGQGSSTTLKPYSRARQVEQQQQRYGRTAASAATDVGGAWWPDLDGWRMSLSLRCNSRASLKSPDRAPGLRTNSMSPILRVDDNPPRGGCRALRWFGR